MTGDCPMCGLPFTPGCLHKCPQTPLEKAAEILEKKAEKFEELAKGEYNFPNRRLGFETQAHTFRIVAKALRGEE